MCGTLRIGRRLDHICQLEIQVLYKFKLIVLVNDYLFSSVSFGADFDHFQQVSLVPLASY